MLELRASWAVASMVILQARNCLLYNTCISLAYIEIYFYFCSSFKRDRVGGLLSPLLLWRKEK